MRLLLSSIRASQIAMAKLKPEPRFARRRVRLTAEEFASLKEVGNRRMQRTIPNEHRDRLIAVGYVRAIVPYSPGLSALALTGAGLGDWSLANRAAAIWGWYILRWMRISSLFLYRHAKAVVRIIGTRTTTMCDSVTRADQ